MEPETHLVPQLLYTYQRLHKTGVTPERLRLFALDAESDRGRQFLFLKVQFNICKYP